MKQIMFEFFPSSFKVFRLTYTFFYPNKIGRDTIVITPIPFFLTQ